jgi:hypothetical protein
MNRHLPLREREGMHLELKPRDILATPEKVARAAVAMLNAEGGEVWVGIREAAGENIVEPVQRVERERDRLQDSLLDLIEPRPLHGELAVSVEGTGTGDDSGVLLVKLSPGIKAKPYAVLGPQGARSFVRRFDNRTVPMTRDEIRTGFQSTAPRGKVSGATSRGLTRLRGAVDRLHDPSRQRQFSVLLEPDEPGELDLSRLAATDLMTDPTLSGTRRGSYNYSNASLAGSTLAKRSKGARWLEAGSESLTLRLFESGGIQFESALEAIAGRGIVDSAGRSPFGQWPLLNPEALTGYTVSILRLAAVLLQQQDLWADRPGDPLWATLVITGLRGHVLLPGLGLDLRWPAALDQHRYDDQDFEEEPRAFSLEDVRNRPDACGLRLLKPLYWSFGWSRDDDLPSAQAVGLGNPRL